jgi:hypothetical protein
MEHHQLTHASVSSCPATMTTMKLIRYCAISFIFTGMAVAHGGAHQKPVQADANANWATKHMAGMQSQHPILIQCSEHSMIYTDNMTQI